MESPERRGDGRDRRLVSRGGRRAYDQPGKFPRVLVAESYDGARIPCVKYLDRFGFFVHEAATAAEAIAQIELSRPHIVLTECALPSAPVSRILETLRRCGLSGRVPLVVMTSDLDLRVETPDPAALVAVLLKPFSLSAMLAEIRRLLREQPPVSVTLPSSAHSFDAVLTPGAVVDSL